MVLTGGIAQGKSVWIGYTNALAVTNCSQELMNQVGQGKWYFAHASVGECILEGVTNLNLSNPGFYQLHCVNATSVPPGSTSAGVIYNDDRGNLEGNGDYSGDWQWKVAYYQTAVSNGWHYPTVSFALSKFCFLDIWYTTSSNAVATLLNSYLNSIQSLEVAYPQTVFVYATMPVTTLNYTYLTLDTEPTCDYWRNVYNNGLRTWCAANNRVLFDIADIEAHDTNGNPTTFIYSNLVCQQLYSGYNVGGDMCCGEVGDGAHPTNFAAEELLARGFYALAAALAAPAAASTTTLASSANPSVYSPAVTFTATVSGTSSTPTGTVRFKTNGVAFGNPVALNGSAIATITGSALSHGSNTITAEYSGDTYFLTSTGGVAQVIDTPPVGGTHYLVTTVNSALTVSATTLAGLDYEADGDALTISAVSSPSANNVTVVLNSDGTITYGPASSPGTDRFTYTISNGFPGGTATSTAIVTVRSDKAMSVFNQISTPVNNTVTLRGYGIPGHTYDVQKSSDLSNWTTLGSTNAAANGIIVFTDDNANTSPRYYRFGVH